MPDLVVMMPAFNAERTIVRAMRSTLRAMPADAELTVFDDASTDGTLAAIESVPDRRVRILRSYKNVGGGEARRRMMAATDSRVVAGMDADDYCLPWRFTHQLRQLESVDLSFAAVLRARTFLGPFVPSLPLSYTSLEVAVALLVHNPLAHPTVVARRGTLERVGGYRPLRLAQDYDLWLRLAGTGATFHRSGLATVVYRTSAAQQSRTPGYARQVGAQPELVESYRALASTLLPPSFSDGHLDSRGYLDLIAARTKSFHPLLRWYYASVLRRTVEPPVQLNQ